MQMMLFTIATILPVTLILQATLSGGAWAWAAITYMAFFAAIVDRFIPRLAPDLPDGAEFPSGKRLSVLLGALHFVLLVTCVYMATRTNLALGEKLITLIAAGLWFGQVTHPNAHELIHRPERYARYLGRAVYASLLFGHHASAHLLVHHIHVGNENDPNSCPRGIGFYRYFLRAWYGSFRAGLEAENALRARKKTPPGILTHPYFLYVAAFAVGPVVTYATCGWPGLAAYLFLCLYAHVQILLSDYVQHYGLRRAVRDTGKPEPVSDAHSWNSPHWFSSALMVNAPRHSDHHLNPTRPYPGLRLRETMPMLPHSLPVMGAIAFVPPLWRKVMARELARLPDRDGSA